MGGGALGRLARGEARPGPSAPAPGGRGAPGRRPRPPGRRGAPARPRWPSGVRPPRRCAGRDGRASARCRAARRRRSRPRPPARPRAWPPRSPAAARPRPARSARGRRPHRRRREGPAELLGGARVADDRCPQAAVAAHRAGPGRVVGAAPAAAGGAAAARGMASGPWQTEQRAAVRQRSQASAAA